MMRTRAATLLLAIGMVSAGCGLFAAATEPDEDVHVVLLSMDGCRYVIAEARSGGAAVIGAEEPLTPGDILIGTISTGSITVARLPFPREDGFDSARIEVLAGGGPMTEARRVWREACPEQRIVG